MNDYITYLRAQNVMVAAIESYAFALSIQAPTRIYEGEGAELIRRADFLTKDTAPWPSVEANDLKATILRAIGDALKAFAEAHKGDRPC